MYRDPEPKNVVQLRRRLRQAWKTISEQTLLNLVKSLPDRLNHVIKRKGDSALELLGQFIVLNGHMFAV